MCSTFIFPLTNTHPTFSENIFLLKQDLDVGGGVTTTGYLGEERSGGEDEGVPLFTPVSMV